MFQVDPWVAAQPSGTPSPQGSAYAHWGAPKPEDSARQEPQLFTQPWCSTLLPAAPPPHSTGSSFAVPAIPSPADTIQAGTGGADNIPPQWRKFAHPIWVASNTGGWAAATVSPREWQIAQGNPTRFPAPMLDQKRQSQWLQLMYVLPRLDRLPQTYAEADTFLSTVEFYTQIHNFGAEIVHVVFHAFSEECRVTVHEHLHLRPHNNPPSYAEVVSVLMKNNNLGHPKAELTKAISQIPRGEPVLTLHHQILQAFRRYVSHCLRTAQPLTVDPSTMVNAFLWRIESEEIRMKWELRTELLCHTMMLEAMLPQARPPRPYLPLTLLLLDGLKDGAALTTTTPQADQRAPSSWPPPPLAGAARIVTMPAQPLGQHTGPPHVSHASSRGTP